VFHQDYIVSRGHNTVELEHVESHDVLNLAALGGKVGCSPPNRLRCLEEQ